MGALYGDEAEFSDPVFPSLNAKQVRAMWAMLTSRSKDLKVSFVVEDESPTSARVRWNADYTFSKTGRAVHNRVVAKMELRDGLIVRHVDEFSFWRWSAQALGTPGRFLGWTPLLRAKIQSSAKESLRSYLES